MSRTKPPPEVHTSQRFLIARNWYKRPTLQHVLVNFDVTACGMPTATWPYRSYTGKPMEALLCIRCAKNQGIKLPDWEDLATNSNGTGPKSGTMSTKPTKSASPGRRTTTSSQPSGSRGKKGKAG